MFMNTLKNIGISIFFYLLQILILSICGSIISNYPIYSLIGTIITILIFIIIYKKDLLKKLKEIKKDFNLKYFLIGILGIILVILLDQLLIHFIGHDSSNNELVIKLLKSSPILMTLNVVLLTPFKEELIFRYPYKDNNPLIGLIVSSIIFAFIHLNSLSEIIFIIPYLILALVIGLNFFKTNNNIYISYMLHALNNLINVLLLIW